MTRTLLRLVLLAALGLLASPGATSAQDHPVSLSLSVNQSVDTEALQGWPLVVTGSLLHADAFAEEAEPVVVNAVEGSWAKAVQLVLRDAQGTVRPLPFTLVTNGSGALTLDAETAGTLAWAVSGEATAALSPGAYTLEAVVPAASLGTAGLADAVSPPVTVRVVATPSGEPAAQQATERMRRATYEAALGEYGNALVLMDRLLAAQPGLANAHFFRGQLLEAMEEPWDALAAYQEALRLAGEEEEGEEPPVFILEAMNTLVDALEHATAFEVTVTEKPASHPFGGQGSDRAFALDGIPGRELYLERGKTYTFRLGEVPAATPFLFTRSAAGGPGAEPYTGGISGTFPASGTTEFTFTPGADTPDLLYYGSPAEPLMGWRLFIRGGETPTGDEPGPVVAGPEGFELSPVYPNPFREQARLTLRVEQAQHVTIDLFDVLGRRVARLHDAPLASGVAHGFTLVAGERSSGTYIVRVTGASFSAVRTVVLNR